jgi:hypothetical protein
MMNLLWVSFDEAQDFYVRAVYALPFLSIPIYSIFAMLGKGLTRRAFYFSVSMPGLFTLAYIVWGATSGEPRPYLLHPAYTTLIVGFVLSPGYLIFPIIWTIQLVLMVRGNWGELRWSSLAASVGLLLLYVWDGFGINLARS